MNFFLSSVMFSVKKVSFPTKTAGLVKYLGSCCSQHQNFENAPHNFCFGETIIFNSKQMTQHRNE